MRKVLAILAAMMLLLTAAGCAANKEKAQTASVPVADILEAVKEKMAEVFEEKYGEGEYLADGELLGYMETDLTENDSEDYFADMILDQTEIDIDLLEEGVAIMQMMGINSDQIIILKAKKADDVDALKSALEKALAAQTQTWEQYLPDQYEKVKNNRIVAKGNYLIYITADDPEAVETVFNDQLK